MWALTIRNSLLSMLLDCVDDADSESTDTFLDALLESRPDAQGKPDAHWLLLCLAPEAGPLTVHLALRLWVRLMKARPALLARARAAGVLGLLRQLLQVHWHIATVYPTLVALLLGAGSTADPRLPDDLGLDVPALVAIFLKEPRDCTVFCRETWSILLAMLRNGIEAIADARLPRRAHGPGSAAEDDNLRAVQRLLTSLLDFVRELYLKVADFRELLGSADALDELVQAVSAVLVGRGRSMIEARGGPPAVLSSTLFGAETASAAASALGIIISTGGMLTPGRAPANATGDAITGGGQPGGPGLTTRRSLRVSRLGKPPLTEAAAASQALPTLPAMILLPATTTRTRTPSRQRRPPRGLAPGLDQTAVTGTLRWQSTFVDGKRGWFDRV